MIAMPKKLPMNNKKRVETDICKRSGLRTRTLDIKKDCTNEPKCQQWAERYMLELKKEHKLSAILSDFHGFLSNANGKLTKQLYEKLGVSPLKCLSMNNSFDKKFSSNNSMAVDFDHMYMNCNNSKASHQTKIELKQLKELNVLHLDIIEQQADEISAKDKCIKNLEEENKNLQAQLKTLEKHLSSNISKEFDGLSQISVKTEFCDNASCPCCMKSGLGPRNCLRSEITKSPRNSPGKDETDYCNDVLQKKDLIRKCSPRNICQTSIISPPVQNRKIYPRNGRLRNLNSGSDSEAAFISESDLDNNKKDAGGDIQRKSHSPVQKRCLTEDLVSPKKQKVSDFYDKNQKICLESECITDHSLRSREKLDNSMQINTNYIIKPSEILQVVNKTPTFELDTIKFNESQPLSISSSYLKFQIKDNETQNLFKNERILTTTDAYYLPTQAAAEFEEVLQEDGEQTQVEIPKWRIKPFASLYVMEGTENLEDEIFTKRHSKPEHDERRRKRWDLQRMREQRQYDKLRERYDGRNSASDSNSQNKQSMWPNAEYIQTIVIEDYLPVCAFGQLLAKICQSDFTVPWLIGKSPVQVCHSTRRKKR